MKIKQHNMLWGLPVTKALRKLGTKPYMDPTPEDLRIFEEAFTTNSGGCIRECHCGKVFYDAANDYDWEKGELESLQKDTRATPLDYSVSTVEFEGREYVTDCDCWHKRARQIKGFIDSHSQQIAEYLKKEKKRLQEIADAWPVAESLITNGSFRVCAKCGTQMEIVTPS